MKEVIPEPQQVERPLDDMDAFYALQENLEQSIERLFEEYGREQALPHVLDALVSLGIDAEDLVFVLSDGNDVEAKRVERIWRDLLKTGGRRIAARFNPNPWTGVR